MNKKIKTEAASDFEKDVYQGLTSFPKNLPSKYFYDEKGDELFQEIMELPEYYLTRCEFNILKKHTEAITSYFDNENGFDLIELGAGDGKKTKILLRHFMAEKLDFTYWPIDISQHILDDLKDSLNNELPNLKVEPLQDTYFKALEKLSHYNSRKKVIMFLGSNLGNLPHKKAIEFLKNIQEAMTDQDMLFMGFDQKKEPRTILNAYNDKSGVTAEFNKNLLRRINRELNADFQLENFKHWQTYNPESGTVNSFLVSLKQQKVNIEDLQLTVDFKPWETIHTEISQKYDDDVVEWLANKAGLTIVEFFTDENKYYKNYVFKKI